MPRASNGTYTLPNTVNPVVAGTTITSNWANTTMNDIASVLTSCLDRAGRGAMQADLAMGGFKVTGLADGVATGDAATFGQLDSFNTALTAAIALKLNASAVSAFGLTLIDDADAAAARTTLGTDIYKTLPNRSSGLATGEVLETSSGVTIDAGTEGFVFAIFNNSASPITITQGSGVTLRWSGTLYSGNIEIGPYGEMFLRYYSSTLVVASGTALSLP